MNRIVKPAMVLGLAGILAVASMTPSEARNNGWAAAGIGFAAGALVGAAAANANNHYYAPGYRYGYGPDYAYDDAYAYQPAPVYVGPAYRYRAPAYANDPAYAYTGDPAYAYGRGYGYNSNTVAPWQERRLRGTDY